MTRMLVLWCPDWPLVALGIHAATPAAVVHTHRVVACTAAARDDGVRIGMRVRDAQRRCPNLATLRPDPDAEARAFEPVAAAVEEVVPRIQIVRPGLLAAPSKGAARYFGGDAPFAARVLAAASALGHPCRVGVADGLLAATLAARQGDGDGDGDPTIVAVGTSAGFLAPFPVGVLSRPDLADLLIRLGVHTLGDFAALPASDVFARFGDDGAAAHRLARGLDAQPLAVREPPPEFAVELALDPPVERVDAAAFAARTAAAQLHEGLDLRGLACLRVRVEAQTESGEHLSRVWRHDGALTSAAIADRVRWQLDGWLTTRGVGREGGITVLRLVPEQVVGAARQLGLWGEPSDADERVGRALTRVQGLLGHDAVTTAVLGGGRGPAEQVTWVAWGSERVARFPDGPWPGRLPAPSPALIHQTPLRAALCGPDGGQVAVGERGELSAPPATLAVADGPPVEALGWSAPWPYDERWWGDERWWSGSGVGRRVRLQVATSDGAAHLLIFDGESWAVEASYD